MIETAPRYAAVRSVLWVGIRLSPTTPDAGNTPMASQVMETYGYLMDKLNAYDLAYLHFVEGATAGSRDLPERVDLDALHKRFKGSYMGNNGYDLELAVERRAAGLVDLVAFGRPFIANPDLVERFKQSKPLAESTRDDYYGGGAKGYTDRVRATA